MKKSNLCLIILLLISTISGLTVSSKETNDIHLYLPSSFDYRNIAGVDYTTPIKNQAPAPTCEAYALVASLETIMQYQRKEIFNPDLSETHLYFSAGGTYEAGYVNLVYAANYVRDIGVPDEGCYPDPHRPYDYPFTSLEGWENRTVRINEWGWVDNSEEAIKTALIQHGPLIFCAHFWQDFHYYSGGVYRHQWGQMAGGHVMTIVGYDDSEQCWIVKNSAGTDWGIDGWLKMAYDAGMITGNWYSRFDENCTGILYINGSSGNIKPDVPKVQIQHPEIFKTYINGIAFSSIFNNVHMFQKGAPRIIGDIEIQVISENTENVAFYIDDEKMFQDDSPPYTWLLEANPGLHTLKVVATNGHSTSIDLVDFQKIV